HFIANDLDFNGIQARVDAMAMLGVPYGAAVNRAPAMARDQARHVAASIVAQGGPQGLERKEVVAIIAYLQRLGKDIQVAAPNAVVSRAPDATAGGRP
ncbi:MAG: cbb3-type cytochrome c oxidase subunit II, partial [Gemmatimonadaceae bacterium]